MMGEEGRSGVRSSGTIVMGVFLALGLSYVLSFGPAARAYPYASSQAREWVDWFYAPVIAFMDSPMGRPFTAYVVWWETHDRGDPRRCP